MSARGLWALSFGLWATLEGGPGAVGSDLAQDLVAVAPQAAKVEYEDARVRVVRLRMEANTTSPMHDRPRRVVIPLTENKVRMTRESGEVSATNVPALRVAWSEPGKRSVTNLDTPFENIIVELKQAATPGVPLASPPSPPPPDYLSDAHHVWLFENQYVRTYDVRIPPGVTSAFHRHALDAVRVTIADGLLSTQLEGQEWVQARQVKHEMRVTLDSRAPFVHRVRNDGPEELRYILVQIKK